MSNEKTLKATATEAQIKSLMSIRKQGLVALKYQSTQAIPNSALNTQSIEGNICVNHINLTDALPEEIARALNIALYEEYCGIYGILMERQWGLQRAANEEIMLQELEQRLQSSVVFILHPPRKGSFKQVVNGNTEPTDKLSYYELHGVDTPLNDGFSQRRGKSLGDQAIVQTTRVTEIKTVHSFALSEIRSVLVPSHLINIVRNSFSGTSIEIIEVPLTEKEFTRIPAILGILYGEKYEKRFTIKCPDFLSTLTSSVNTDESMKNFSLHAVRLHTSFDFMPRYILNYGKHLEFIEKNHGKILSVTGDHAWVIFHKSISTSRQKTIDRLRLNPTYSKLVEQIEKSVKQQEEKFQTLKQMGGDCELFYWFKSIPAEKIKALNTKNIALFSTEHYTMFAFANEVEKKDTLALLNPPTPASTVPVHELPSVHPSPLTGSSTQKLNPNTEVKENVQNTIKPTINST